MSSKHFMPRDRQLNGLITSFALATTYLLAAIAGTWWLDGDLLRGAIAIAVLGMLALNAGLKIVRGNGSYVWFAGRLCSLSWRGF
ncbi:hypothetical protein EZI54_17745 [Marinobacter halodurans]|uniref:Uncharacterized protein n=1 Tax=Marinobacter halodurans TaxID=2528979 RepID=A0ABY1ZKE2_9GAMM|nr:hypothetical protein [Marinobacter halodurans]TBW50743.1 hypothetical protein EZI54_17745 [Marinobacter halodurans]